jgi:hypothetical protein
MYTLFTHQYLWNKLWQCLDADGGHFEHLHWIQNSRTSLISIFLLYKYSSYDYRVIFVTSKCVYIFLGHSVYPTRCNVTHFILSVNCSTCFGWYFHPSSGAQTVSTESGICQTVTVICRYRGRVGTGLSVLWVACATHSTLKTVPTDSGR